MGSRTGFSEAEEAPAYEKSVLRDYAETILICIIFVLLSREQGTLQHFASFVSRRPGCRPS